MSNNDERKRGIGGSDCAAAMGLSRWKSAYQLWQEKTAEDETVNEDNEQMYFGKKLEPLVLAEYAHRSGNKVHPGNNELVKSEKYNWLFAHPDGTAINNTGETLVVEAKTTRFFGDDWGEQGTDYVPQEHLCQVALYCLVLSERAKICGADIAALGSTSDFRVYHYDRNKELEQRIIEMTHDFWVKYVIRKEPPPIDTTIDRAKFIYLRASDTSIPATSGVEDCINRLAKAKKQIKDLEKQADDLQNEIQLHMMGNSTLLDEHGTRALATWKEQKRISLDVSRLKNECPDIYARFRRETTTRTFLIKRSPAETNEPPVDMCIKSGESYGST